MSAAVATPPQILIATPVAFTADGALDVEGSREIFRKVARSDADGAFILGTTGEFIAMSDVERDAIAVAALDELGGKRVVVHVGAASVFQVKALIDQARERGVTDVAVLEPFYLPAIPDAVRYFFREVAAHAAGMDVYAYLFTARTGTSVSVEELVRIAEIPGIVGVKISGKSLETVASYRAALPAGFAVFTGSDRDFARVAEIGADGVVSGIASVFPEAFTGLRAALVAGNRDEVARRQSVVEQVVDALRGNPAWLKHALRLQGVNAGYARMPLSEPTGEALAEIERVIREYA